MGSGSLKEFVLLVPGGILTALHGPISLLRTNIAFSGLPLIYSILLVDILDCLNSRNLVV